MHHEHSADINVDFFSRIGGEPDPIDIPDTFPDEELFHVVEDTTWYADVLSFLTTGRVPEQLGREEITVFFRKARPYLLIRGVLHKQGADQQTGHCLEKKEIEKVIRALYEGEAGGHFASQTTSKKILAAGYWWPTLFKDTHDLIKRCDPCQRTGRPQRLTQHPLTPILLLALFEKWGIDYIGPIHPASQSRRNQYIILATDYASKWVEARATIKDDAQTTARFLYEQILTRFKPPLELVSDRGTHFLNETIVTLTDRYLIRHRKTTPYHPKANGLTERANGIIGKILNKTVAGHKREWDDKLLAAVHSYNLLISRRPDTPLTS